tara:strand:- start:282 stop:611 length:330 start_codon:yes stop_codon:yes gene_type:complete
MKKIYQDVVLISLNISYVLYILAIFGITLIAPKYVEYLRTFLKIYIGLILVTLYNPITYKERGFTYFDRRIVFSAGMFLLLSTTLISAMEEYIRKKTSYILNITEFNKN